MDTAATELECFQELQKQEHLAASYRIQNLSEEVSKQKALERTLQSRYGELVSGFQRIQEQVEEHKRQLKVQEAVEAESHAQEEEAAASNHAAAEEEDERKEDDERKEEDGRKSLSSEEKPQQTSTATDEEPAGSKGTTEDQMDVDSGNGDGGVVGPVPPAPDTEGGNDEVSVQEISEAQPLP